MPRRDFLERIFRSELPGFTSSHVLSDVAHRLMTLEAAASLRWTGGSIPKRLRQHPGEIRKLTQFRQAIQKIPQFGVQTFSVSPALVETAAALSQQFGLLSGDALIVAVMQANGLTNLASNDADFDRVPGISRYAPA